MKIAKAREVLSNAGGADVVCREARTLFERFGTSRLEFVDDVALGDIAGTLKSVEPQDPGAAKLVDRAELGAFPAIARFGAVDGIWSDDPPRIKTRQYTALDHFIVDIIRTEDSDRYRSVYDMSILEQVGPCVFVRE